jgi:hypothetical protein
MTESDISRIKEILEKCEYALRVPDKEGKFEDEEGKFDLRCEAPKKLADKNDRYNPINSKNPEDPRELILCLLPNDLAGCEAREYWEGEIFQKTGVIFHNYLKSCGH